MSLTLPRLKRGIPVVEFLVIFNFCGFNSPQLAA
jgi:hypothetical protein